MLLALLGPHPLRCDSPDSFVQIRKQHTFDEKFRGSARSRLQRLISHIFHSGKKDEGAVLEPRLLSHLPCNFQSALFGHIDVEDNDIRLEDPHPKEGEYGITLSQDVKIRGKEPSKKVAKERIVIDAK